MAPQTSREGAAPGLDAAALGVAGKLPPSSLRLPGYTPADERALADVPSERWAGLRSLGEQCEANR